MGDYSQERADAVAAMTPCCKAIWRGPLLKIGDLVHRLTIILGIAAISADPEMIGAGR